MHEITPQEFALFKKLIYQIAGIHLCESKTAMLVGRLERRLRHHGLSNFSQYYRMLSSGKHPEECQVMVNLLTTHETYFFREPAHFEFLRHSILPAFAQHMPLRVWSAASSSGEEAYSLAMTLAEYRRRLAWEVVASDISTSVLEQARTGHYPMERNQGIPPEFLKKYCLEGIRRQTGTFLVSQEIRQQVQFQQVNLTQPIPERLGLFDVIFLRNVMIYFDMETKQQVINHLLEHLAPNGFFIIGHAETLNGVQHPLAIVRPTIYRNTRHA